VTLTLGAFSSLQFHKPASSSFVLRLAISGNAGLTATDFDPKELPPDLTHDEVIAKIASPGRSPAYAKGSTGLVGWFVNPWRNPVNRSLSLTSRAREGRADPARSVGKIDPLEPPGRRCGCWPMSPISL
jgi:hypothetical protein